MLEYKSPTDAFRRAFLTGRLSDGRHLHRAVYLASRDEYNAHHGKEVRRMLKLDNPWSLVAMLALPFLMGGALSRAVRHRAIRQGTTPASGSEP